MSDEPQELEKGKEAEALFEIATNMRYNPYDYTVNVQRSRLIRFMEIFVLTRNITREDIIRMQRILG